MILESSFSSVAALVTAVGFGGDEHAVDVLFKLYIDVFTTSVYDKYPYTV